MKQKIIMAALLLLGMGIGTLLAGPLEKSDQVPLFYWEGGSGVIALKLMEPYYTLGAKVLEVSIEPNQQSVVVRIGS